MSNDNREEDGEMASGLTVEQHDVLRSMLDDLPDTVPPRAVWERIESQAQAEGLLNRPFLRSGSRWLAGSGIAAAVVLAVLGLPGNDNLPGEMAADGHAVRLRYAERAAGAVAAPGAGPSQHAEPATRPAGWDTGDHR